MGFYKVEKGRLAQRNSEGKCEFYSVGDVIELDDKLGAIMMADGQISSLNESTDDDFDESEDGEFFEDDEDEDFIDEDEDVESEEEDVEIQSKPSASSKVTVQRKSAVKSKAKRKR